MSPELISTISTIFGTAALILGGNWALIRWSEKRLGERIDKLDLKIDLVAADVVDLKVAVARLEWPAAQADQSTLTRRES